MAAKEHNCEDYFEERSATPENPYHYVGSGLPHVYLTSVKYYVCRECGKQSADIPALNELLIAIARSVVNKHSPLIGAELRFLRKRLSRRSIDFAAMLSLSPEHFSKLENNELKPLDKGCDKLVRVIYRVLSGDHKLKDVFSVEKTFEKWITSIQVNGKDEKIVATWVRNREWRVETETIAA